MNMKDCNGKIGEWCLDCESAYFPRTIDFDIVEVICMKDIREALKHTIVLCKKSDSGALCHPDCEFIDKCWGEQED